MENLFSEARVRTKLMLIMVVDDDADTALSLKLLLEGLGYTVDVFTNPIKALSAFKPYHYELIFLDVKMPHMDGFELYQEFKKVDKKCKVCFITAFEAYYQSLKEFFPKLDVTCFISKPVTRKNLLEHVTRELGF